MKSYISRLRVGRPEILRLLVLFSIAALAAWFVLSSEVGPSRIQIASPSKGGLDGRSFSRKAISLRDIGDKQSSLERLKVERQLRKIIARLLEAQVIEDLDQRNLAMDECLADISLQGAAFLMKAMSEREHHGPAAEWLFNHWARSDPRSAMEWAHGLSESKVKLSFMNVAVMRWATISFTDARDWVIRQPEGEPRNMLLVALGNEAIAVDPQAVIQFAELLPDGSARSRMLVNAAGEWAVLDLPGAMAWARQIDESVLRQEVLEQIVVGALPKDLHVTASIALLEMARGIPQDRALLSLVKKSASSDPRFVSTWLRDFPDDSLGQEAVEILVTEWASQSLSDAGKWVRSLAPGRIRNQGILTYARVLRQTNRKLAEQWEAALPTDL